MQPLGETGDPGRTRLFVRFRLRGVALDPDSLTAATGLRPQSVVLRGEARRALGGTHEASSWNWCSRWSRDDDLEPLFDEVFAALRPHEQVFAQAVAEGAEASMTLIGTVYGRVIATGEEAERRGFTGDEPFEPFFAGARIWPWLEPDQIVFLARTGAAFGTHIDVELTPDC